MTNRRHRPVLEGLQAGAKRWRIWYLTRVKRCRVSFIDYEGVSHAVEVDANSLYEAVGLAIARFGCAEFVRYAPGGEFLVEAREPSSEHRVTLKQFENWMKRSPRGPRDVTVREKITQAIRGSRASQI